jgi:hypothetical protein
MQYDRFTGKKRTYNHVNWLHKAFKEPEFNLSQCLFGLHRITEDYQKNNCNCRKWKDGNSNEYFVTALHLACDRSKGNFKFEMLKLSKEKGCFVSW